MEEMQRTSDKNLHAIVLPPFAKWGLLFVFTLIEAFIGWRYCAFVQDPQHAASPSELGLPTLFVFSSTAIILLLTPWQKLGLRLKKIGALEFERVVETQATEHAQDYAEIDKRLTEVEHAVREANPALDIGENFIEPDLKKLLIDFLTRYSASAFSPIRIQTLASEQKGLEKLSTYNLYSIRRVLQKLIADGTVETRISKKGNTLYKIAD